MTFLGMQEIETPLALIPLVCDSCSEASYLKIYGSYFHEEDNIIRSVCHPCSESIKNYLMVPRTPVCQYDECRREAIYVRRDMEKGLFFTCYQCAEYYYRVVRSVYPYYPKYGLSRRVYKYPLQDKKSPQTEGI